MNRMPFAIVAVAAAVCAVGCGDEPTRPDGGTSKDPVSQLAISAERIGAIQSVLHDARERSLRMIDQDDARAELEKALETLSARLDARDRSGVERALSNARKALGRYRATVAEESGLLPDIEALSLMLDGVETAASSEDALTPKAKEY